MSKRLVVDVDDTISFTSNGDYANAKPNTELIDKLREYKANGFEIVLYTARNVRTHQNNVGKINAKTLPLLIDWLDSNRVPFDEIFTGKPWCGTEGFYIDDKAIRPQEFVDLSYDQIKELLGERK